MKNTGFMYWDNNPKTTLSQKISECVRLYENRYDQKPNQCFVYIKAVEAEYDDVGIRVIPLKSILKDHFWLGQNII